MEPAAARLPAQRILGIPVHPVDYEQALAQIERWLQGDGAAPLRHICTVNPEFIMAARADPAFRAALLRAELNVPDGFGILWALRLRGVKLRQRVTGADLIPRLARRAERKAWRLFLLGAGPGVAARAAAQLRRRFPALIVSGVHSGSPAAADWPEIQRLIAASRPHILLVAFGHPRQDLWIEQHRQQLPGLVAMGVGGALDFLAGDVRRAPLWMRERGLEWLFRLGLQPWRWRRMRRLPLFALLALLDRRG